jgi:hypothetical protein
LARSEARAASLPGTVPRWRTALARVKIVFVGVEGVEDGVRVGVETFRLVGVKREMVRLADTGVAGRPFRQQINYGRIGPFVLAIFRGVVGGMFSLSCMFSRLEVLDGRDSIASRDVSHS